MTSRNRPDPSEQARGNSEREKQAVKTFVLLAAALLTVLSFAMTPQAAQAARGDRQIIDLWGSYAYPEVDGKAKYRVDGPDRREFEVEVEDALHLLYRTLDVYVDGAWVGGPWGLSRAAAMSQAPLLRLREHRAQLKP